MAYLPEQLEMMLAEEKTKVSELDSQLKSQAHESRMVLEAAERRYEERIAALRADRDAQAERVTSVQFAYYNLVSIHAKVNERVAELEEALGYYASPDVYEPRITLGGTRQPGVLTEGGEYARAALRSRQESTLSQATSEVKPALPTTAQVRCVGCSGILIQQNLCHDCAETTQDYYVSKEWTGVKQPNPIAQILDDELSTHDRKAPDTNCRWCKGTGLDVVEDAGVMRCSCAEVTSNGEPKDG